MSGFLEEGSVSWLFNNSIHTHIHTYTHTLVRITVLTNVTLHERNLCNRIIKRFHKLDFKAVHRVTTRLVHHILLVRYFCPLLYCKQTFEKRKLLTVFSRENYSAAVVKLVNLIDMLLDTVRIKSIHQFHKFYSNCKETFFAVIL